MNNMSIETKIKTCLSASNMTVTQLAKKIGTTQSALSQRIKTGKFTQEELERIAAAMDCDCEIIFTLPNKSKLI